jgi:tRNA(Ile)-lysidine synthase
MREGMGQVEPVAERELDLLFSALTDFGTVVLAVSGGADSMALLHLAARWRTRLPVRNGPDISVATVDHGFRVESAKEARWVGECASALGLRHAVLEWAGDKPATSLQETARDVRYRLLFEHAANLGSARAAVVTAHTEDDQAETLLMRLARGSGLDGLAGMAARRAAGSRSGDAILRPLLAVPRSRLVAFLALHGHAWREDPSNDCLEFERVRIRAARDALAALGLTNGKIALSAARLTRARGALDRACDEFCSAFVRSHGGLHAEIDRGSFNSLAPEVRVRVLGRVLDAFGGDAKPARLSKVEALEARLRDGRRYAQTLGGCMVAAGRSRFRVFRELGRGTLPVVCLEPGQHCLWDRRFLVAAADRPRLAAAGISGPVEVRALGAAGYATLKRSFPENLRVSARAAASLPAFWDGDSLLSVPFFMSGAGAGDLMDRSGHVVCKGSGAGLFTASFNSRWDEAP